MSRQPDVRVTSVTGVTLHDVDEPPVPAFVVQRKPPPIVVPPPREPRISRISQICTVLPSRALRDPRIKHRHWRLFAALGIHTPRWVSCTRACGGLPPWRAAALPGWPKACATCSSGVTGAGWNGATTRGCIGACSTAASTNRSACRCSGRCCGPSTGRSRRVREEAPGDPTLRTQPAMFSNQLQEVVYVNDV